MRHRETVLLPPNMSNLRIAIASSGLGHVSRGIEAWAQDLGRALAERGARVLLCKGDGQAQRDYERIVPCWTRESPRARNLVNRMPKALGWRIGLGSGYGIEQTTFTWSLLKVLRRERIDILHVQDPQVAGLVQRARRLGLVRTRTILAHGTEEPLEFQRKITYLQHLAPWHLEEARTAGVWKPTWTAIPNFIDTETFRPAAKGQKSELREELQIPQEACVVLVAAAIKRGHKRIDYLLGEFAQARKQRPEAPLWFVIAGGWEKETDDLVAEGKHLLGNPVRFLVRFPRERMADLYRAADLFALGSMKEMMPIALLEAKASGLPCLVNRHPVMEWMIGPGGKAIDMATPGALAQEIISLANDRLRRNDLGALARQHCLANFSKDRVVDQILDYYEVVAGNRRPEVATA
jgi:glycosyltransferase involved in cell wall biosynthesis